MLIFAAYSILAELSPYLAMVLTLSGYSRVWGIHAGVLGLALNFSLGLMLSLLSPSDRQPRIREASEESTDFFS